MATSREGMLFAPASVEACQFNTDCEPGSRRLKFTRLGSVIACFG